MTSPTTIPACADAPHAPPPHVAQTLPPVLSSENLSKAVGAVWAECRQCVKRHLDIAADINATPLVTQVISLALIWTAITVHSQEEEPADRADRLLGQIMPGAHDFIEPATFRLLQQLPVQTIPGPDGNPAATWDADFLMTLVHHLTGEERQTVWADALTFLHGVLRGEGRARAEHEAEAIHADEEGPK